MARESGVSDIRTLPAFSDLLISKVGAAQLREVQLEDLLGRQPVELNARELEAFFKGKRILVTGAGGSIGSEICRQLCRFEPASVILVEQEETALFHIHHDLFRAGFAGVTPCLADIRNVKRMSQVFAETKPQVVFHAAAFKHVEMMERHPCEGVQNNILGTQTVAELAKAHGVEYFVLISTDKAVNPTSVMGATKRAAELVVTALDQKGGGTRFLAVRFGNVLGSRGSVLPLFREQLKRGGPLTLTDPRMKRYFMIPSEAVLLVFQAVAMGRGGEVLVLDMGEPVKILDLAHELIRHSGLEPDRDIPIVFTGIKPGEKLFEDILTAEEGTSATQNKKIFQARVHPPADAARFRRGLAELAEAAEAGDAASALRLLKELVPTFEPSGAASAAGRP
jgi:FlaA1/EpsC-like NDP-sugar epimerase